MRGLVAGLESPHPLGPALPALYQDDSLAQRMTEALDQVLAPVLATLDNLEAYLDPDLTPDDFLEWLGQWVGMAVDETWEIERRRRAVLQAARMYALRGTVRGLREQVEIFSGGIVEVVDNGAVGWSRQSGTPLPGKARPSLLVRVTVADLASVDEAALDALVRAAKPAHMTHEIELVQG